MSSSTGSVAAVIFDWGGTLTPWHDIDFLEESRALALAVLGAVHGAAPVADDSAAERLARASGAVWRRSRDHHTSATVADIYAEAGLEHDPGLLTAYREFWEPHTITDPEVAPLFGWLRERDILVGVLSNTVWSREWHEDFFRRDGVLELVHGAIYTSEIAHTKPAREAFEAAMAAVDVSDPARCVYVGDRLFDDIWGASNAGLRTIHIPHSTIPTEQVGPTEGEPDAVAHSLSEIPGIISAWQAT